MKAAKCLGWLLAVTIPLSSACLRDVGECIDISEDGQGGAAGGPLVPSGAGGYGEVPPKPQNASGEKSPGCVAIGGFSASLFKFTTIVADDGQGLGGGWQRADTTLMFIDGRQDPPQSWMCNVTIQMAIRSAARGAIRAAKAAELAADVATEASSATMKQQNPWQPTLFCGAFGKAMQDLFDKDPQYTGYGAQASAKR